MAQDLGLGPRLDAALAALAEGHTARAIARLSQLDGGLATDTADGPGNASVLRARASIVVLTEALTKHSAYFDAGARA